LGGAIGKVPRGTTVAGVEIGGRDRFEAAKTLAHGLTGDRSAPMTVTAGTVTTTVTPDEAGLSVDYVSSVAKALGPRSWDPRQLWGYYAGGREIEPVVDVDEARMDALLERIDQEAGQAPRDGDISLVGTRIDVTKPRDGAQLEHDQARAAIIDAWAAGREGVTLPLRFTPPDIDAADLDAALNEIANPALSGPVNLVFAGSQVSLTPFEYADLLSLVPRDGALALEVDAQLLETLVDPAAQATAPTDASVGLTGGVPTVVKAVKGQSYDSAEVVAAFLTGVTAEGAARTVPVEGMATKAVFTTKDAKALGVVEAVATFTVPVPSTVGPAFGDAVARVSGALLRPGETFSFNTRVGTVSGSAARLATAVWNAGFLAGLADVTRTGSATWSVGLPEGRDATVAVGGADLQMRNDSTHGALLDAQLTPGAPGSPGSVVVTVWSTKEWEVSATTGARYAVTPRPTRTDTSSTCVAQPGEDGFAVDLLRSVARVGEPTPVRVDTVTTAYAPVEAVVCQAVPPAA
jgi:hypothetical protein